MASPIVLDDNSTYATKGNKLSLNIKYPAAQAAATAAEAAAQTRINDALPTGVTVAVAGGTIKVAT
jgi:hypothetical protein